ncbi:MAG: amidohydrolase family protein, partial [Psychrosphaera sp.]|nr:amidohydrolase family protein [Psychrosphaera sp.]
IDDGKIAQVGGKIKAAKDAKHVDGSGKWLIPGMVDSHIHLFQSGGLYTRPDVIDLGKIKSYDSERQWLKDNAGDLLKRYLSAGITTVIDVGGPLANFEIDKKFDDPTQYPNLMLTGPLISTYQPEAFEIDDSPIIKVNDEAEAIALVQKQLPYKPDFIKIWYIALKDQSPQDSYGIVKATIDESHKHGLKVAVHATELETAKLAIKAGADILVHSVKEPIDDEFVAMMVQSKVVYIPTLIVHHKYVEALGQTIKPSQADLALANPIPVGTMMDPKHLTDVSVLKRYADYQPKWAARIQKEDDFRAANLKRLSGQPVVIATGTDAGNIGTMHASSYYDEITHMQQAGLSNLAILQASTINGAKVLGKDDILGSIESGKMADLVLLNGNPLKDIGALKDIEYVIKGGALHTPASLIVPTPEQLAQQQLNAYNMRDLEAFLAPYADDVEVYQFPNKLNYKGKDKMRKTYKGMFERVTDLHCELIKRIVFGNTIIDQERVTGFAGGEIIEATAIYKIKDNKISKVYFMRK